MISAEHMQELVDILAKDEYKIRDVIDMAYDEGRADKYQEIVSEYMLLTEEQVKQVRADAIEEVCKQISERVEYWEQCANAVEKESNEYKIFVSLQKNFSDLAEQMQKGAENE